MIGGKNRAAQRDNEATLLAQLSVYLRLLDVPVPSIYGPSADENPFAART